MLLAGDIEGMCGLFERRWVLPIAVVLHPFRVFDSAFN